MPRIDPDRLRRLLDEINAFGRDPLTGGFDRIGYSAADMAARDWVADEMHRDGLAVRRDAVGNLFGRFGPPEGPAILAGSHLDTVPQGGAFDGALGVAVALECVRALRDADVAPVCAIEVTATAEEEGRFGGMLGSQALAGIAGAEWVSGARDANGVRLTDAMRASGLDPAAADTAALPPGHAAAFLELHIEQGPVLEAAGMPVGIVTGVSGCCVLQITLEGTANHSGTTPMPLRADAFAGLARMAAAIPAIADAVGTDQSRITIGKVALHPDEVHTIPGRAEFSVVLRDTDEGVMRRLRAALEDALADAAAVHRLRTKVAERSWIAPTALDGPLRDVLTRAAATCGHAAQHMPSGAGHDAQTMQTLCPAALIFVPSRGGISHAPQEHTDWADILPGAEVMLAALKELAGNGPQRP
jgi:N-carbamoyl-L-amino-acid hydrolase